jgi:dTDP-4-dehydrorhamnose reductase
MNKKKLLVTGASGQVATEYQLSSPSDVWDHLFLDKKSLDISSEDQVEEVMNLWDFDAVLNLAAYTNVEKAEKEDTEKAFRANAVGPLNLARACKKRSIPLIHVSTDYVFDGQLEVYRETDLENPLNQYGRTKYLGEKWIQENHDHYYILRVSWVYSNHSRNFFTTMLNLSQERPEINVISDQTGSPTSSKEICRAIDVVLENLDKPSGVYHFSGRGKTSWSNFATEIFTQCGVSVKINEIPSRAWPTKVIRPINSYMSCNKFSSTFGYTPMHWKNALIETIKERRIVPVKVGDKVLVGEMTQLIVSTDWLRRVARIAPENDIENSSEINFEILTLRNE